MVRADTYPPKTNASKYAALVADYLSKTDTSPQTLTSTIVVGTGGDITGSISATASGGGGTTNTWVKKVGESALSGTVELDEGTNVSLTQSGQTITIGTSITTLANSIALSGTIGVTGDITGTITAKAGSVDWSNVGSTPNIVEGIVSGSTLSGTVTFVEGSNTTLTVSGNSITFSSAAGGGGSLNSAKVAGESPITTDVVFAQGTGIGLSQAGATITVTNSASASTLTGLATYEYIIRSESGTINAYNGYTGSITFTGTNASTIIQNVIDTLATGDGAIFIDKGTYDVSSGAIELQNDTSYHIVGAGIRKTILNAGTIADKKVIQIVDSGNNIYWNKFHVYENMDIWAKNGYGLYCDGTFVTAQYDVPWFTLRNINFGQHPNQGCKYAMKINGLYHSQFDNIRIFNCAGVTQSIGLWLTNTAAGFHCGNSKFNGLWYQSDDANCKGIYIDATGALNSDINLIDFFHYEFACPGTVGIGIHMMATASTMSSACNMGFFGVDIEGGSASVFLEGREDIVGGWGQVYNISFYNFYAGPKVAMSGLYAIYEIAFYNGLLNEVDGSGLTNGGFYRFHGIRCPIFSFGNRQRFFDIRGNTGYFALKDGISTIASGETIGTGLGTVPYRVDMNYKGVNPVAFSWNTIGTSNSIIVYHTGEGSIPVVWEARI